MQKERVGGRRWIMNILPPSLSLQNPPTSSYNVVVLAVIWSRFLTAGNLAEAMILDADERGQRFFEEAPSTVREIVSHFPWGGVTGGHKESYKTSSYSILPFLSCIMSIWGSAWLGLMTNKELCPKLVLMHQASITKWQIAYVLLDPLAD